jgi:hypothetical protein
MRSFFNPVACILKYQHPGFASKTFPLRNLLHSSPMSVSEVPFQKAVKCLSMRREGVSDSHFRHEKSKIITPPSNVPAEVFPEWLKTESSSYMERAVAQKLHITSSSLRLACSDAGSYPALKRTKTAPNRWHEVNSKLWTWSPMLCFGNCFLSWTISWTPLKSTV